MTAASPPRRESLGELIRATIIAILIVLSTVPITFAYAMIVDPEETVGGLLWDQFRLNDLADEATRDFPEFLGPAAEQGWPRRLTRVATSTSISSTRRGRWPARSATRSTRRCWERTRR